MGVVMDYFATILLGAAIWFGMDMSEAAGYKRGYKTAVSEADDDCVRAP